MPTVCKISLDASEYRSELNKAVNESRSAAADIGKTETAVPVKAEVDSKQLNGLKDKIQQTEQSGGKLRAVFGKLIPGNVGEEISKGASALSALGAAAGFSVPPVGMLGVAVKALLSPIISRLREIDSAEQSGNRIKAETMNLLSSLESQYGSLGAQIDVQTGKVKNLAEVEERLNRLRNSKAAAGHYKASESAMNEAKAAYMKVKGNEWLTTEGGAGRGFEMLKKNLPLEQLLKMMETKARTATEKDDIQGYGAVADKLRVALEERNKARKINATGFETQEEADRDRAARMAEANQAQAAAEEARRQQKRSLLDSRYESLKGIDSKKANRNEALSDETKRYQEMKSRYDAASEQVKNAPANSAEKADALKRQAEIEKEMIQSENVMAGLKQQIAALDKERALAYAKLIGQTKYELEYGKLIAAGEYEKARILKLEKELRDQNLKLTEEEKQKVLEARKAQESRANAMLIEEAREEAHLAQLLADGNYAAYEAEKLRLEMKKQGRAFTKEETEELQKQRDALKSANLKKGLKDQAFGMYGKAMEAAGMGRQFAEEKALKEARDWKGADLTQEEADKVRSLSRLTFDLDHRTRPQFGDLSIKTNSLTARGGFRDGAVTPDKDKYNRMISEYSKKTQETLKSILDQIEDINRL